MGSEDKSESLIEIHEKEKHHEDNIVKSIAINVGDPNQFDMSSLSPLQEKAINELFALTDTRKGRKGMY